MFQGGGFGGGTNMPFSGSTFGKPTTSAFGTSAAPVFGGTGGSSLFGASTSQQQPASTGFFSGGTFGQPQTSQSSFGAFGGGTTQFGQQANANTTGGGLFGSPPFGSTAGAVAGAAKPGGFTGFGSTTQNTTGLFGAQTSTAQQTPTLFGQPQPNQTAPSLFSGFGAGGGGTTIKFTPVTGTDTMMKNGQSSTISTRHHCITCMKEYENKSLEELRMEDYAAGRKGSAAAGGGLFGSGTAGTGLFSATSQPSAGLFGAAPENKNLFGTTNTGFGSGTMFGSGTNTGTGMFGKPAATATPFGSTATSTSTSFGFNPQTTNTMFGNTQSSGFFGSNQTGSAFGTQQSSFTPFGSNQQQTGLFNQNKTNFSLGTSTGNTGFQFGGTPAASGTNTASAFGQAKPGFTGFGAQTTTTSNTFGSPFGAPASTQSSFFNSGSNFKGPSAFSFGTTSTSNTLGSGLNLGTNTGGSLFGNTQSKPGGLFGNTTTSTGGSLFGTGTTIGGTSGGFGTLGTSGGFGTLGGSTLGGGLFGQPQQQQVASTQPVNNQLNQHMLALASMPFGDSPLFKNLLPASASKSDESLKATSPAAQRALASGVNYKISPKSSSKLRHKLIRPSTATKTSLFEGLDDEEASANGEGSFIATESCSNRLKLNVRRLTLRPRLDLTNQSPPAETTVNSNWAAETTISPSTPFTCLIKKKLLMSPQVESPASPSSGNTGDDSVVSRRHVSFAPSGVGASSTPAIQRIAAGHPSTNSISSPTSSTSPHIHQSRLSGVESPSAGSSGCISSIGGTALNSSVSSPKSSLSSPSNKENKDVTPSSSADSDSDSDSVQGTPTKHPTGIVLRRSGYYTIPSLADLTRIMDSQGRCIVDNFTVGRLNYGNVFYPDSFDVANLDLDKIVHFRHKEVVVYPDEVEKPPVGQGLNRRAQVTLDRVWPIDRTSREVISDPARIASVDFESKLRTASSKHGTKFIEYRPQTGSWVFKVEHFSKYGLTDSDEDESGPAAVSQTPGVAGANVLAAAAEKRRLAAKQQALGLSGPITITDPKQQLDHLGEIEPLADRIFMEDDDEEMVDNIPGQGAFDMLEVDQILSPTSKLSREFGHSSHKLQLMKSSFFHDDSHVPAREKGLYDVKAKIGNLMKSFEAAAAAAVGDTSIPSGIHERLFFGNDSALPSLQASFGTPASRAQRPPKPPSPSPSECMDEDALVDEEESMLLGTEQCPDLEAPVLLDHGLPWLGSTAGRAADLGPLWAADLALGGACFRPGWGAGSLTILATPSALAPASLYRLDGRNGPLDDSPTALVTVRLAVLASRKFKDAVVSQLDRALKCTEIHSDSDGYPVMLVRDAVETLEEHCRISSGMSLDSESVDPVTTVLSMHRDVWSLCKALWSPLTEEVAEEDIYGRNVQRRSEVCRWLENVVRSRAVSEAQRLGQTPGAVFSLMTCHDISGACDLALSIGDMNTSLIVSQTGYGCRELISRQLNEWKETCADRHIDQARLKLFTLAAGMVSHKSSFDVINCCQELDWLRAFALHFWYVSWCTAGIGDALEVYDLAWKKDRTAAPPFAVDEDYENDDEPFALLYHLLKLYTNKGHPMENLLDPATHTSDPLDYSLSWLLMRVLTALGYSHLSESDSCLITKGFSSQLESLGLWHWAVFVLLHLDTPIRKEVVCDLIERHIACDQDAISKEHFLREKLHVPDSWIARAKASALLIAGRYEEAADNLIIAEEWNDAHELIMDKIVSKAIVNERYDVVEKLLKRVANGGGASAAAGWATGGAVILDYLQVMHLAAEVTSKLNSTDPNIRRQQMISAAKLDETVMAITDRIAKLATKQPIDRLCQTEMGERLARLCGRSVDRAKNLAQLPLPPDFSQSHWIAASECFLPA